MKRLQHCIHCGRLTSNGRACDLCSQDLLDEQAQAASWSDTDEFVLAIFCAIILAILISVLDLFENLIRFGIWLAG